MTILIDPSRLESFGCVGGDYTLYDEQNGVQYATHYFTTTGTSTFQVLHGSGEVQTLVVAGGGGGGMDMGGGGGGGGVIFNPTVSLSHGQTVSVTVGAGGRGAPAAGTAGQNSGHQYNIRATNGGNSVFGSITATGGGYGGSSYFGYTPDYGYGGTGGCGGGASGYSDGNTGRGAAGTAGQGFSGGNSGGQYYSGGGGGAAGSGASGTAQANGGAGIQHPSISSFYWGGGGGGAAYSLGTGGNGGIGGGGGGAVGTTTGGAGINNGSGGGGGGSNQWANTPGGNAGANTGGGGGGGAHYNANNKGGDGGSGIVLVRYPVKSTEFTTSGLGLHYDLTNTSSYPGSGTTIFDLSGNGLNATGSSAITGQALQANQPYSTATTSLLNDDTHTICFSIQINNTSGSWDMIFQYAPSGTDRSPGVWRYPSNRLIHWRYDSGNSGVDFGANTTTGEFTINTWYYFCVVKNGGTAQSFVNGVRVATANVTNPKYGGNAPIRLYPGYSQNSSIMRHVHVYNRPLSAEEVINNWRSIKSSIGY